MAEIVETENDVLERDMVRSQETPSEAQETEGDVARRLRVERERQEEEENAARQRENVGTSRRQYRKNATASSASRNQLLFHRKRVQTAAFTKISAVSVAAVSGMARRGERKNSITGAKQSTAAGYRAAKSRKYRRNSSQSIRRPPKLPSAYGGTDTA